MRYDFASDNTAGMAPGALAGLMAANEGFVPSYGVDPTTKRAADLIRQRLDADAEVRFIFSGTAANSIAVSMLARPYEAVLTHHASHICTDETGAPGFFGQGVGLIGLPGYSGKIDEVALLAALNEPVVGHRQPAAALSLTQATEYGTVYTEDELSRLIKPVKAAGMGVHMDGARLANAVAAGFDLKSIAKLGVDILVLGGAKSGASCAEALVVLNPSLTRHLDQKLKQSGQTASKARFLSGPIAGLLESGEWEAGAAHANLMAQKLADGIEASTSYVLAHPVEANTVFVRMPVKAHARLNQLGWACYQFDDGSVRLACSWATKSEAVDQILADLAGLG